MTAKVKTRRYDSPRRREQAASTRAAILDAARGLFERHGYAATSVAAIADEAGVAAKTVYLAFDTKSGILRALWHPLLRGDDSPTPVDARGWFLEVLREPDPERQLRMNAHNSRVVKERAGSLLRVIRDAAPADPDAGELWHRIETEFHANQRQVIDSLAEKGALKSELDRERATDVLWALNHPSTYLLLADVRGWKPDEYEKWLGDAFCAQLLERSP
jgi:AcrR family transcriptional regulator